MKELISEQVQWVLEVVLDKDITFHPSQVETSSISTAQHFLWLSIHTQKTHHVFQCFIQPQEVLYPGQGLSGSVTDKPRCTMDTYIHMQGQFRDTKLLPGLFWEVEGNQRKSTWTERTCKIPKVNQPQARSTYPAADRQQQSQQYHLYCYASCFTVIVVMFIPWVIILALPSTSFWFQAFWFWNQNNVSSCSVER